MVMVMRAVGTMNVVMLMLMVAMFGRRISGGASGSQVEWGRGDRMGHGRGLRGLDGNKRERKTCYLEDITANSDLYDSRRRMVDQIRIGRSPIYQ